MNEATQQLTAIKDECLRLKYTMLNGSFLDRARQVPRSVYFFAGTLGLTVGLLALVSFSLGSVLTNTSYESVALAKPAATSRTVRQREVAEFGTQVSNAFGIRTHVAHEFADWIIEASERQQLEPELLASLVLTESSFRKTVRSHVGAVGPAQVRPDYWGAFCGAPDLLDPEQNVYCGAQVLSHFIERCEGDHDCALAAYNTGFYSSRKGAAQRYLTKIERHRASLENARPL